MHPANCAYATAPSVLHDSASLQSSILSYSMWPVYFLVILFYSSIHSIVTVGVLPYAHDCGRIVPSTCMWGGICKVCFVILLYHIHTSINSCTCTDNIQWFTDNNTKPWERVTWSCNHAASGGEEGDVIPANHGVFCLSSLLALAQPGTRRLGYDGRSLLLFHFYLQYLLAFCR